MTKNNNKLFKTVATVKTWLTEHNIINYLNILIFAFITSFWSFLMTGTTSLSLVYFVCSICVLLIKAVIFNKKDADKIKHKNQKILYAIFFSIVTVIAFIISLNISDPLYTLASTLIWIFVYISYQKTKNIKEWTAGALIPFGVIIFAEYMQNSLKNAWTNITSPEVAVRFGYLLGLFFVIFACCLFTHILNSKRLGYYATGIIFGLLTMVNFFVYAYTEQPFTITDLKIATTAAGVLKTQAMEAKDWIRFVIGIFILIAYFVIVTLIYQYKKLHNKKRWRIIISSLLCVLGIGLYSASNLISSNILLYQGHMKYGFIGNFYITLNNRIEIPKDAEDYVIEDKNDKGDYRPNVIIIMNEAFSDFEKTFDVTLNEDPIPYFHSLQEKYPNGITYSSVKGNNTCSSEWELLSGSPTALTAKGAMIYKDNDKPMRSIVSLFNSRNYTTVGMHPYYNFGYNRNSIYHNLGFDQVVFMEDMPEDLEKHRTFIKDEENYKEIIKKYEANEKAGDNPFFCFNITMQNHGNYKTAQSDNIHTTGKKTFPEVNTYLSGLKYSDEALKMLITYFESIEEDTIILFFGDHQPMIDNEFYEDIFNKPFDELTLEELKKIYEIPYLIWANYDINKEAAPDITSNCYLTNVLFEVGNIPKSTWLNMVNEYQKEYPVITTLFTIDSRGMLSETNALLKLKESEPNDALNMYQKYSYGILFGLE